MRNVNQAICTLGLALVPVAGMSVASASHCTDQMPPLQAAIDRAVDIKEHASSEQLKALAHGAMRKSTGRDAMEIYDAMTSQIATSGQDAARQSAGKPTIYQQTAKDRAARLANAQAALKRAYVNDAASDDKGCQASVDQAKHLLLGG